MPKIVFVGRMGWLVANTKTNRKKTPKKNPLKCPKSVKNEHFEKRKKSFSPIVLKNIFSKKIGYWVENCGLYVAC